MVIDFSTRNSFKTNIEIEHKIEYKIEIALLTAFSRNLPYIDNAGAVQLYRESGVAGPYEG